MSELSLLSGAWFRKELLSQPTKRARDNGRPAGTQPSFSNLDGARCSVERQKENEGEEEEVKEEEEGERCEEERRKEKVVWTRPPVGIEAPVNYVKRARARRLARLEEQRQLDLMREKSTEKSRADEEYEELIAECFCGECGAFTCIHCIHCNFRQKLTRQTQS